VKSEKSSFTVSRRFHSVADLRGIRSGDVFQARAPQITRRSVGWTSAATDRADEGIRNWRRNKAKRQSFLSVAVINSFADISRFRSPEEFQARLAR
jgi:hypothetical protein